MMPCLGFKKFSSTTLLRLAAVKGGGVQVEAFLLVTGSFLVSGL